MARSTAASSRPPPPPEYSVVTPKGAFVKSFSDVVTAIRFMRSQCPPGSRCMKGDVVLAARVASAGQKATLKGVLGKRGGRKGALDAELEGDADEEGTVH